MISKKFLVKILFLLVILAPAVSFAINIDNYTLLVPLPGISTDAGCTGTSCKTDMATYLRGAFNLAIAIAAILAFVMLVYGGFQYATTDALSTKSSARSTIENAITGLLLAIASYTILYTINPQMVNFQLSTPGLDQFTKSFNPFAAATLGESSSAPKAPYIPLSADQVKQSNALKDKLYNEGIGTYAGPCTTQGVSTGCVNLNDLPQKAITGLESLRSALSSNSKCVSSSNCDLLLTGGTEGGHAAHGLNKPVVDLSMNNPNGTTNADLFNFIVDGNTKVTKTDLGLLYTVNKNGVNATFLQELNPPHWHVVFN